MGAAAGGAFATNNGPAVPSLPVSGAASLCVLLRNSIYIEESDATPHNVHLPYPMCGMWAVPGGIILQRDISVNENMATFSSSVSTAAAVAIRWTGQFNTCMLGYRIN